MVKKIPIMIFGLIVMKFILIILSHTQLYGQLSKLDKIDQGLIFISVGKSPGGIAIDLITYLMVLMID